MHTPQGYYEYFCICQMQINDCLKCVLGQICCEFVFNGLKNFHFVIFSTEKKWQSDPLNYYGIHAVFILEVLRRIQYFNIITTYIKVCTPQAMFPKILYLIKAISYLLTIPLPKHRPPAILPSANSLLTNTECHHNTRTFLINKHYTFI